MKLPNWLSTIIFIVCAIIVITFFENWGWIGVIIFLGSMVVYQMWNGRHSLQAGMENIESKIFGKPLHKDYWDKGELKNHKVKIVWKKQKQTKKKKKQ